MIVMSNTFERICEDVIDKRGRFIYFKNTNLFDEKWCLKEIPISAYLKFYEDIDHDKRIIVIQQDNTYEYYKIYELYYYDDLLYLVCEQTTDKEITKMNQVCRKNDKKANGRNEMSLRFHILLSKFDKIGEVIIVSDIKKKVSGYKTIMSWAMIKECFDMKFYEDSKRHRCAILLMNNLVLHLGLGYVNNHIYAIAEKKDKRSLRSFRKVEKIVK